MKKLTKFILLSFVGPFILTFFIAVFVLLMQTLWLYMDELLGKGIEWYIIVELVFYLATNVVPLALPLAVLLASLMTFGNLGEHFELVSFKAAGISLQRVMRPLTVLALLISVGAFMFSNYVTPIANLKFYSLLHDVRSKKPAVNIKKGVFYNEIEGYSIRVMDKKELDDGDEMLYDVMIYNHMNNVGNRNLTLADSAIMKMSEDKSYFSIQLFSGIDYQEKVEKTTEKVYPLSRISFEENEMRISLEGFEFTRTDEDAFKHDYRFLNLTQLDNRTDTVKREHNESLVEFTQLIETSFLFNDTIFTGMKNSSDSILNRDVFMAGLNDADLRQIYGIATNNARTNKGRASAAASEILNNKKSIARMAIEWHRKYSISIACFIMFLIGAPLGAIVKKGGLGMPVVISVVFFLIFWMLSIYGEKMAKEMVIFPYQGMWASTFVLLPLGIFFTYKATTDSTLFNMSAYTSFFSRIFKGRDKE